MRASLKGTLAFVTLPDFANDFANKQTTWLEAERAPVDQATTAAW
jgi:hypothetical protein